MPRQTRIPEELQVILSRATANSRGGLGVFRRQELLGWGIADSEIRRLVRRRLWTQIRFGVYADSAMLKTASPEVLLRVHTASALMSVTEPAAAFATSAAVLHRLPLPSHVSAMPWLLRHTESDTRSLRRSNALEISRPDIRVVTHDLTRLTTVEIDDLTTVDDIHAAISAATLVPFEWAVALLDAVLWDRPDRLPLLDNGVAEWPYLRGIGRVRKAARLARPGAQSPLESISRVNFIACHLPEPQLQVPFYDEEGLIGLADMYWEEFGVIGEADGAAKYETREDLVREKVREDRLRRQGFTVVRWMWSDIANHPGKVASEIRSAAGARSPSRKAS